MYQKLEEKIKIPAQHVFSVFYEEKNCLEIINGIVFVVF